MLLLFWRSRAIRDITDTDILHKPVNCVLAGQQVIRDRINERFIAPNRRAEKSTVTRSGTRRLRGGRPSFTTRTDKRGYD